MLEFVDSVYDPFDCADSVFYVAALQFVFVAVVVQGAVVIVYVVVFPVEIAVVFVVV